VESRQPIVPVVAGAVIRVYHIPRFSFNLGCLLSGSGASPDPFPVYCVSVSLDLGQVPCHLPFFNYLFFAVLVAGPVYFRTSRFLLESTFLVFSSCAAPSLFQLVIFGCSSQARVGSEEAAAGSLPFLGIRPDPSVANLFLPFVPLPPDRSHSREPRAFPDARTLRRRSPVFVDPLP